MEYRIPTELEITVIRNVVDTMYRSASIPKLRWRMDHPSILSYSTETGEPSVVASIENSSHCFQPLAALACELMVRALQREDLPKEFITHGIWQVDPIETILTIHKHGLHLPL